MTTNKQRKLRDRLLVGSDSEDEAMDLDDADYNEEEDPQSDGSTPGKHNNKSKHNSNPFEAAAKVALLNLLEA